MYDLLVSLVASVIAGGSVWLAQRLLRQLRVARRRAFFGLTAGGPCALVTPRHVSSPRTHSVHRRDVQALVELATIAKECGARPDVVAADEAPASAGRVTEFCVGAPIANSRTAAHVGILLPGVRFPSDEVAGEELAFQVGDATFRRVPAQLEYVLVVRAWPAAGQAPVFLLAGQTAVTNAAAARFLADRHRELFRTYRAERRFCLLLKVVESGRYGLDRVELVADVTDEAFGSATQPAVTTAPGE